MPNGTNLRRGLQPEDILAFKAIDDVQLSPDGERVAYVIREIDVRTDAYRAAIWIVHTDGSGEPVQFTRGRPVDRLPRWSPDGKSLAFLSTRDGGRPQLYVMPTGGGEARRLTNLPAGAGEPVWSPDGLRLVFAAPVVVDPPPKDRDAMEQWRQRPKVIDRIPYKLDGTGFLLSGHLQLFVVPADGGDAQQITNDLRTHWHPAWSPDGHSVAFSASRTGRIATHLFDIWTCGADGSNARQITEGVDSAQWPSWSPDGEMIAFYGPRHTGDPMSWVWTVPAAGGAVRPLTEQFDREVPLLPGFVIPPPAWSADASSVTVTVADRGEVRVVRCNRRNATIDTVIEGERWVLLPSARPTAQRIAFVASTPALPGDVHICDWDGGRERRLTEVNERLLQEIDLPQAEWRAFANPNGGTIHGRLLRSPAVKGPGARAPAPLLVDVHGGPQGFVGSRFGVTMYQYTLAARGWVVLALNPSGSGSYGRAFVHSTRARWGEYDFPEQMAAIDALVSEGIADPDRLAITGYSYGGFMTAWMITQTDRFKAAVIGAPIVNHESDTGTSDVGVILRERHFGDFFRERDIYRRLSPANYADRVTTPTLLLHGEADDRCPLSQSEEFFAGLMIAAKAPVQLVTYPSGSHGFIAIGRPSHRVDFNRRVVEWVERWTLGRTEE